MKRRAFLILLASIIFSNMEFMHQILQGNCLDVMNTFPDNHFNCIVTDPPYGIQFMSNAWDKQVPGIEYWQELLRICKPGTMALVFGGTRTYHRLACALEDAGWQIRDCIMYLYGSGFPKSNNFGKKIGAEWAGYGTALKPAYEPIILAMKPLDETFANNAIKWGVGGINIDDSRIQRNEECKLMKKQMQINSIFVQSGRFEDTTELKPNGRWPANLLLDEESAEQLDEMTGILKSGSGNRRPNGGGEMFNGFNPMEANFPSSSGGASRFFYCAKSSSKERGKGNSHPCVKPIKLLEYLIKLLAPPKDALLLDPFLGSGSLLLACKNLRIKAVGIELSEEYCKIAEERLSRHPNPSDVRSYSNDRILP